MFKLKKITDEDVIRYNTDNIFPDITDELKAVINIKNDLKKGILNYLLKDRAGHQFNAIRLCSVPEDVAPYEEELEDLKMDLEEMADDDIRYKNLQKSVRKLERKVKKLKDPHKYMDTICESFKSCPLYRSGDAPEGCFCPFEYRLVGEWTEGYLQEFEVDISMQGVDKSMISQLVVSDLIIYRCMKAISTTSLVEIGEKQGDFGITYEKKINSYLDIKEKETKNRLKILNNMIGTRADKKKFKVENTKSNQLESAEGGMKQLIKDKESIRKTGMKTLISVNEESKGDKNDSKGDNEIIKGDH